MFTPGEDIVLETQGRRNSKLRLSSPEPLGYVSFHRLPEMFIESISDGVGESNELG